MELCTEQGLLRGEHLARAFGPQGQFPAPGRRRFGDVTATGGALLPEKHTNDAAVV